MTVTVQAAGVDTWSPSWYIREGSAADRALSELCSVRGAAGSRQMPDKIDGYTVGYFPSAGLAFAEGHGAPEGLGSPDALPERLYEIERSLWDYGLPVEPARTRTPLGRGWHFDHREPGDRLPGFAGVRRCDSTVDLSVSSGADGLAILAGVASMLYPRSKTAQYRAKSGHIETVYLLGHAGRKVLGRWYDKGIEANTAPRGMLIRPEDQRRYSSSQRRGVEELTGEYVREKFRERFAPLWRATKGITVGGMPVMVEKLSELVESGELTARQAELLAGHVVLSSNGVELGKARTLERRRAELRDHGLVVADEALCEVQVDLHEVLGEALESPAWGARG